MKHELTRDALAEILDIAELDNDDVDVHFQPPGARRDYCVALVGVTTEQLDRFLLAAGRVLDADHAPELFGHRQVTTTRIGQVFYWTSTVIEDYPDQTDPGLGNEWERDHEDYVGTHYVGAA